MLRRDPHDDPHLRQLIDQRSARSAMALDCDSPSVYSSPFFSPRPSETHLDTHSVHSYHSHRSPPSPRAAFEPRNRLNELAESMLDLEDDSRTSSDEDEDVPNAADADPERADDSRMSILGPKMRFHGKAPWELDDALEEEEEELSDRTSSRGRDGFRKGLGFRSSSRGTTASGRPSVESSRSHQTKPKRSFETTSSANSPYGRGGALHALGQATLSSTSLVPQPAPRQTGLRLNFPLSGSEPPSSPYATPSRTPGSPRSMNSSRSNAPSPVSRGNYEHAPYQTGSKPLTRRATNDSATTHSHYSEEMHPYANPDLVVSYADDPSPTPAPARSAFNIPNVVRSDSTATVTESLTTTSLSRSATGSTLTPDTSASSMSPSQSPRSRMSMFHGKEISAPLPLHPSGSANNNISSPLMAPSLPAGWTERSASPTFALISLEEARAQRSRSSTAHNPSTSSTSSTPFPEAPSIDGHNQNSTNATTSRARARSISTGARAKAALQNIVGAAPAKPERRDSEPSTFIPPQGTGGASGKTLKHKKSGFMRLFNGARGANMDDKDSPPPVPSLSEGYAAFNAQQQGGVKSTKGSIHRVPPPQVSPSMFQETNPVDDADRVSPSSSSRPTPPSLSIKTGSQSRLRAASTTEDFQTRTVPSDFSDREWQHQHELPQSAPANVTEFPALKLRPVSTLFSAHFGDHIVLPQDSDSQSALDADADTLSSTSPTSMTPITPGLLSRGSGENKTPMATISEDQSSLAQAFQEQMANAKKAWQRHIWELEGQVRDLKAELEALRTTEGDYCDACGRGKRAVVHDPKAFSGVVNRPRARTGTSARLGSAV